MILILMEKVPMNKKNHEIRKKNPNGWNDFVKGGCIMYYVERHFENAAELC